ncbi:helix-turn-helix domain-containing protein [Streptomyces sp. NPDC093261]|uniref:helix-turn-helix domain-containing protein n=1 Tax=Streptomyces sp. NPDC093261 TaxID=3366037 RepID=UPI0037F4752C
MAGHLVPTVRRRRLGADLRRLREAAGVKMEDAAGRIDTDRTKISRVETGRQSIKPVEVEALLKLYGVEDEQMIQALRTLAREGRRKNWWQQYSDGLSATFRERLAIESDAAVIRQYSQAYIPGLLQTADYAETVIRAADRSLPDSEIDTLVRVRLERQEALKRDKAPQYICLLDEAVLRRPIGSPTVMAAQLRALLEVSELPDLLIQIVPFEQGWHAGLDGPFEIFSYPDPIELDVVALEYLDGAMYLEEDEAVAKYCKSFDQLRAAALSSRQSQDLISRTARDLD